MPSWASESYGEAGMSSVIPPHGSVECDGGVYVHQRLGQELDKSTRENGLCRQVGIQDRPKLPNRENGKAGSKQGESSGFGARSQEYTYKKREQYSRHCVTAAEYPGIKQKVSGRVVKGVVDWWASSPAPCRVKFDKG